jgi:hypothetical protein
MGLRTKYFLLGAVAFWAPDVVIAAVTREASIEHWYLANPIIVASVCLTYAGICKLSARMHSSRTISAAFYMLVGIYLLASSFMLLEQAVATFRLPPFHTWRDWGYMILSSFFPPLILIMSGYDGSIFALLFVTVFLIVADQTWEKRRRKLAMPPSVTTSDGV